MKKKEGNPPLPEGTRPDPPPRPPWILDELEEKHCPCFVTDIQNIRLKGCPKIVVLCGSSRFVDIMAVCAWLIEKEEQAIAMGLHLLPYWYRSPSGDLPADHLAEHENVAEAMDALHLKKIDLANEIFVVNKDGYIGDSTQNEIRHAEARGINIRYMTEDYIFTKVLEIVLRHSKEKEKSAE